ncbi:DUF2332 family protein [Sneathiella sp. P13V-1]|uniref:DUF2332 domain-containing protein n=1 Tax=Sneathiella sp. P13V-1 TaxID=2697366 RepID=UPI00187BC227|nr:DUF2332 family protein [Sneathiella sp. P13V-1]MBE7638606.1 DUF2332 family protein [Sneathiella sp. P13V-1]
MALKEAFEAQADSCEQLGSPFTARVLRICAKENPSNGSVWEKLQNWPGDVSANGDAVALRFTGALHGLVLKEYDMDLARVYPQKNKLVLDDQIYQHIIAAVDRHADYILERLKLPPQTNEVRRSSAILLGAQIAADLTGCQELMTSEIGASSGLNLFWDKFRYQLGDRQWGADSSPVHLTPTVEGAISEFQQIDIVDRAGCDLNPLNLRSSEEKNQLLSYIWPDQEDRMARTQSAIDIFCRHNIAVDKANAIDWLDDRFIAQTEGVLHLVYHTVVLQYFPEAVRSTFLKMLNAAGERATSKKPLAWLSMEADAEPDGALLQLTIWPSGQVIDIARVDFHGRWIRVIA